MTVEQVVPRVVFDRDGWVCGICEEPIERDLQAGSHFGPSIDHIIPLSHDGEHSYANVQAAHKICNCRRRNADLETYKRKHFPWLLSAA